MAASRSVTHALICPMLQTQHNLLLPRLTEVRSGLSARRLSLQLIFMGTAASGARSLPCIGRFESELGAAPREVFFVIRLFPRAFLGLCFPINSMWRGLIQVLLHTFTHIRERALINQEMS